jgi:hypothetical protein
VTKERAGQVYLASQQRVAAQGNLDKAKCGQIDTPVLEYSSHLHVFVNLVMLTNLKELCESLENIHASVMTAGS